MANISTSTALGNIRALPSENVPASSACIPHAAIAQMYISENMYGRISTIVQPALCIETNKVSAVEGVRQLSGFILLDEMTMSAWGAQSPRHPAISHIASSEGGLGLVGPTGAQGCLRAAGPHAASRPGLKGYGLRLQDVQVSIQQNVPSVV
nr:hypothetical protein CFP56_64557 [Quercus suber]